MSLISRTAAISLVFAIIAWLIPTANASENWSGFHFPGTFTGVQVPYGTHPYEWMPYEMYRELIGYMNMQLPSQWKQGNVSGFDYEKHYSVAKNLASSPDAPKDASAIVSGASSSIIVYSGILSALLLREHGGDITKNPSNSSGLFASDVIASAVESAKKGGCSDTERVTVSKCATLAKLYAPSGVLSEQDVAFQVADLLYSFQKSKGDFITALSSDGAFSEKANTARVLTAIAAPKGNPAPALVKDIATLADALATGKDGVAMDKINAHKQELSLFWNDLKSFKKRVNYIKAAVFASIYYGNPTGDVFDAGNVSGDADLGIKSDDYRGGLLSRFALVNGDEKSEIATIVGLMMDSYGYKNVWRK